MPPNSHMSWIYHLLLALSPVACSAVFGADVPAPVCKPFRCPEGTKPAGNGDHQISSYGCEDSGMNILSMDDLKDLNNPLGGKKKGKNVNKCCVERDICKQTCGTTSQECHNNFQACKKKICKGDQNCELSAMMADIRADPIEDEEKSKEDPNAPKEEYNYEKEEAKRKCRGFEAGQNRSCVCVPDADWQLTTDSNLKAFYRRHAPEKLDDAGDVKGIEEVWKKWKGKEPQMFQALTTKYKAKAVTIKAKPSPPPYTPPPAPPPLSPEEQEKEDKRMADLREKWRKEDEQRAKEKAENERRKLKEQQAAERKKREAEEGETVEL